MVHVRWFFHGGDTFLRETAGPKELFLVDRCDDIYMVFFSQGLQADDSCLPAHRRRL